MKNVSILCIVLLFASCHSAVEQQTEPSSSSELGNVRSCFNDCVLLLQGTPHHETLHKLLFQPNAHLLAQCLSLSSEIAKQNKTAKLQGDFSKLRWTTDGTRLITLEGKEVLFESAPQICSDYRCYKVYVKGYPNAAEFPEVYFPISETETPKE